MRNFYRKHSSNALVKGLRNAALTVAGLLVCGNAAAFNLEAGTYYFDNTNTKWENVYMRVGKNSGDNYVAVYKMSPVNGNLNLYSYQFNDSWNNYDAIQFAAVEGYTTGIYDGNNIESGKKSVYVKEDFAAGYPLTVAATSVNDGYYSLHKNYRMPNALTKNFVKFNGVSVADGANLGYYNAGVEVSVSAQCTLGFDKTFDHHSHFATLNYGINGSTDTQASMSGNTSHTKDCSVNVILPSTPGQYTFKDYMKMGGVTTTEESAIYNIVGFSAESLNFGSVSTGSSSSKAFTLTNVWGGDGEITVSAEITGSSVFSFDGDSQLETTIPVSSKTGSTQIYFKPTASGDASATLTVTLTCADGTTTVVNAYTLTGFGSNGSVAVIKSSRADVLEGPVAILHGYIQYTGCEKVIEVGFYYGTSEVGTEGGTKVAKTLTEAESAKVASGYEWQAQVPAEGNLAEHTTYYYRPYIVTVEGAANVEHRSEKDYTFKTKDACNYTLGDTIYVNVDKAFAADNDCKLQYVNLENAINAIKANSIFYNSTSKNLNHNIVILVAPNAEAYEGSTTPIKTGGESSCRVTLFQNINNSADYSKVLIVRSSNSAVKPTISHIEITNSKNILFDNVRIEGHAEPCAGKYDNAIDIDMGKGWEFGSGDYVDNANIVIKNCYIYSNGFTCIHVSAYDGVILENNEIEASLPDAQKENANTNLWGASVKIIHCKDFRFLRNNFRGSHATSVWAQGLKNSVIMNNVFWNENDSYYSAANDNLSFIRLVYQFSDDKNENLGIYYNTMFLKNNERETKRNIDFFRLSSGYISGTIDHTGAATKYNPSTIRFMYNNCYSYDLYVAGRNSNNSDVKYRTFCVADESAWCESVTKNNFWSFYDEEKKSVPSVFVVGCNNKFTNVAEIVCSTAADDPGTLVIKGAGLNYGYAPTTSYAGENTYFNDRLHPDNGAKAVRSQNGKWTLGAYQQTEADKPIDIAIWWGGTEGAEENWDNRNNWRKPDGSRITCVDNFASDLKVVIPASNSTLYPTPKDGIKYYPTLPAKFAGERTKIISETVNAGQGISEPTKFASSIELEYGAAIKGITALKDDEGRHYDEVTNHFEADRKKWLLVGTVVKPFADGSKSSTRLIKSGDYYLNKLPHVYMRQAQLVGGTANWDLPFASLEETVNYDQCFAVKLPDQYGEYKYKASRYYKSNPDFAATEADAPKTFNFNGWFLNDDMYPEVKVSSASGIMISNTYPANFNVKMAGELNSGTVKYYNYEDQEFQETADATKEVKSQNGFIFIPNAGNNGYFRLTKEMLSNNSTRYRSAVAVQPYFYIKASNPNGEDGSSSAGIYYDPLKTDAYNANTDLLNTVISTAVTKPEVYIDMYDKELDRVVVPDLTQPIPLGLVLQKAMTVEFSYREMDNIETAVLEDRATGAKYDLLEGKAVISTLAKGTYTGRFYLNLSESETPDVPTDVEDVDTDKSVIEIYGDDSEVIISSSENVTLQKAEITDMAGRTTVIKLKNAHYNKIKLNGLQGVYVVKAIGDSKTETAKIIVK